MTDDIDFGDLNLTDPHKLKVEEMLAGGHASVDGLSVALQNVIDQQYQQFDGERRSE